MMINSAISTFSSMIEEEKVLCRGLGLGYTLREGDEACECNGDEGLDEEKKLVLISENMYVCIYISLSLTIYVYV